jgi:hypothetical protein
MKTLFCNSCMYEVFMLITIFGVHPEFVLISLMKNF